MEAKEESNAEAMGQQPQGGGKSSSSGRACSWDGDWGELKQLNRGGQWSCKAF